MAKYLQYPCHFCGKKEGKVLHLKAFACRECVKTIKDHSQCTEECTMKTKTDAK